MASKTMFSEKTAADIHKENPNQPGTLTGAFFVVCSSSELSSSDELSAFFTGNFCCGAIRTRDKDILIQKNGTKYGENWEKRR